MTDLNDPLIAFSILGFITFGAFLGYLGGRSLTRIEQQAAHAMWTNHR